MANLLIVDDKESIRDSFQYHFRENVGWHTEVARDGEEAKTLLREKRTFFDGIILDKNMPRASGDQVVQWMYEQELLDDICVVLLTGFPEMPSAIDALRMGVWQYLIKDMTPTEIQTFIAPGIAQKQIYRIRRDIWTQENLSSVLDRIQKVVRETLAPESFHVIFLSPFLSRDLSDGSAPSPNRAFVERIKKGARFLSARTKADVAALQPVLADAGTLMAVPAYGDRGVLGVLVMESRKENAFDPRWKDVLTFFAEIISLTQVMHDQRQSAGEKAKAGELVRTNGELHHRVANSLGIIKQSARDLEQEKLSDSGRDRVRYIASHSTRIENVLRELKDLSRPPRPVMAENIDVARVVRNTAEELATRDPDVLMEVPSSVRALAWADEEELREALVCLINNAFESIEERRAKEPEPQRAYRIRITLVEKDTGVEIAVSDDGIGFDEDTRERLFNPLFSTKTRRGKLNEGYGLYTSQRVVKSMGGSIEAFSEGAYRGATFTIRLEKGRE
jgi:signal transduction histidine kinase/FixJ family two-component response regulator